MSVPFRVGTFTVAVCATSALVAVSTRAEDAGVVTQDAAMHDGQHDFDYLIGSWKIHLKRLVNPLTGSNKWVEFDGTVICQKIWDGRGELEQFDVDSPEKHIVIHGLTIRLYNSSTHQWHIYWSNADRGMIDWPPVEGHFTNGRGEFYDQEDHNGRPILVRYVWTRTNTSSPHFEQSYSADWGKTWEVNWITDQTKQQVASPP
jgi:hypothetical protein